MNLPMYDFPTASSEQYNSNYYEEGEEEEKDEDLNSAVPTFQEIPSPLGWPVGFVPRRRGEPNLRNEDALATRRDLFQDLDAKAINQKKVY